ncbi:hypothetical protein EB838_29055, partial [Klebsiella pneumoniae]
GSFIGGVGRAAGGFPFLRPPGPLDHQNKRPVLTLRLFFSPRTLGGGAGGGGGPPPPPPPPPRGGGGGPGGGGGRGGAGVRTASPQRATAGPAGVMGRSGGSAGGGRKLVWRRASGSRATKG